MIHFPAILVVNGRPNEAFPITNVGFGRSFSSITNFYRQERRYLGDI